MKNKIIKFVFAFFLIFLFKLNSVNAEYYCVYGEKYNDASSWDKMFTFRIDDESNYSLLYDESPFFKKEGINSISQEDLTTYDIGFGATFVAQLYLDGEFKQQLKRDTQHPCPESLKFYYNPNISFSSEKFALYHDELDKPSFVNNEDKVNELIEINSKDKKISEIVDKYGCYTYSLYMSVMKKYVEEKGNSCENNPSFNEEYRELIDLCDSFRSTSGYSTIEGGEAKPKSCSKACSLLKDDVADMCNVRSDNNSSCNSLGHKIIKWIFKIIRIVRYVIPALLIILSMLDFIKAISDEEKMKEATSKFFKRLIAAALIFIVPFILDFILKIFDIPGLNSNNPFCAK